MPLKRLIDESLARVNCRVEAVHRRSHPST